MKSLLLPTVLASAVLLTATNAQSQTAASAPTATAAASSNAASSGKMGKTTLASADVSFMKHAAEASHLEVEGSTLAGSKAGSEAVKTFAKQMVEDHTKAGAELQQLAAGKNVALPERPSLTQRAKLKLLGTSSGAGFDKKYADSIGVSAHTDTVKLFKQTVANAKDADVKAFAVKTLPALEHHLEMAKQLKSTVSQTPAPKSGA